MGKKRQNAPPGLVVVLTGGVASGKSVVSSSFANRGVPVVDTDVIAHELVEPGQPVLDQIISEFGQDFLGPDGCLDRRKMREAIFTQPDMKARLERILHPAIVTEVQRRLSELGEPLCIVVIPLLAETGRFSGAGRVLVVDVDESVQIQRVMARDGISKTVALAMLDAQASRSKRLALADDVIDNSGSLEQLEAQVNDLFLKYQKLASAATG